MINMTWKHPLETLLSAGILLLALLSCLLPAPSLGLTLAQKLVETFHMMDLNQLYPDGIFCLWFMALGSMYLWCCAGCGVAGFPRALNQERRASVGATVVLFAVGARRLIEGPGKDAGKGLLRIKAMLEADIVTR